MSYPGQYQPTGASAPGYAPQPQQPQQPDAANGVAVYDPGWAQQQAGYAPQNPYAQSPYAQQAQQPYGQPYAQAYGSTPGAYGTGYYVPSAQERSDASMVQYLAILIGFIAPLIYWGPDKSPFVRYHARQAMNISLTYLIFSTVALVVGLPILMFLAVITFGIGSFLMFLFPLMALYPLIAHIMGGSKASNGEWSTSMAFKFFQ